MDVPWYNPLVLLSWAVLIFVDGAIIGGVLVVFFLVVVCPVACAAGALYEAWKTRKRA